MRADTTSGDGTNPMLSTTRAHEDPRMQLLGTRFAPALMRLLDTTSMQMIVGRGVDLD